MCPGFASPFGWPPSSSWPPGRWLPSAGLYIAGGIAPKLGAAFRADDTWSLVLRLRHSVIKTGLRKISLSYSRISFADICAKLKISSPTTAEYICAKAIRDGVIDAVIDHDKGWLQSTEVVDTYSTSEPQRVFHRRIQFCLETHNEAVKAMSYPPDAYKDMLESAEKRQKREREEEELLKEIEEDDDYW